MILRMHNGAACSFTHVNERSEKSDRTQKKLVTHRKRSLGQGTPPLGRYTPPWEQCMLGDAGNKQAVRILLECILV